MGLGKSIVVALLNVVTLIFLMAACGTSWAEIKSGTTTTEYTYWEICSVPDSGDRTCKSMKKSDINCDKRYEVIEAGRAFTLIATIFIGVLTIVAFVRIFIEPLLWVAAGAKKYYLAVGILGFLFAVFAWIDAFALYAEEYCGTELESNRDNNKIGVSGPASFVGSCVFLVSLIIECIFADADVPEVGGDNDEKKEEESSEEMKKEDEAKTAPDAEEKKEEAAEEKKEEEPAAEEKKEDEEEKKDE